MTDDETIDQASAEGFEFVERTYGDRWVHGWARGDDERWPYLERRQAIAWMADRLQRSRVFV